MLLTHFYALAGAGALLTAAWLFRPRTSTEVTTLTAFFTWSLVALLGDELIVATAGELVAAPLPAEARFFAALWAILSAAALVLHVVWDAYPPDSRMESDN
jgi:phosphate/sulfate permease